jgi:hypothetical protein
VEETNMDRDRSCTSDPDINRLEKLAEEPDKSKFHNELHRFLEPLDLDDSLDFLGDLRICFEAEKKLHPKVDLPHLDVPLPREIALLDKQARRA